MSARRNACKNLRRRSFLLFRGLRWFMGAKLIPLYQTTKYFLLKNMKR